MNTIKEWLIEEIKKDCLEEQSARQKYQEEWDTLWLEIAGHFNQDKRALERVLAKIETI